MHPVFFVLEVLTASLGSLDDGDLSASSALKRFREEYPPAAMRLIEKVDNVELRIRRRRRMLDGREVKSNERLARKGYSIVRDAAINTDTKTPIWTVLCRTHSKIFNLGKPDASAPFVLGGQDTVDDPKGEEAIRIGSYVERYADCMVAVVGNRLVDLLRDPSFDIKHARESKEDGQEIVLIEFSGKLSEGDSKADVEGTIKLAPRLGWPIVEVNATSHPRMMKGLLPVPGAPSLTLNAKMTYTMMGGDTHLKSFHERAGDSLSGKYQDDEVDVIESKYGSVTDDQFTLGAFGLPEVPLRPRPASGFFSWKSPAIWITLSLCVITFGSMVLLRRRARARAA